MWIAPNMVTLLGFMWIVANVLLIVVFMPDLLGPVSTTNTVAWVMGDLTINTNKWLRAHGGCTLVSLLACGCE